MPRRADLPCADCGKLMWRGTTSLPEGQARCRPCRKISPGAHAAEVARRAAIRAEGRPCTYCGEHYHPTQIRAIYCSKNCSRRASEKRDIGRRRPAGNNYRARVLYAEAWIEHTPRLAVFMRDGWTCHLCNQKVSRDAVVPAPDAPTLDHVVPLSRGGEHSMSNVRLACFACNTSKGNRIGYQPPQGTRRERVLAAT